MTQNKVDQASLQFDYFSQNYRQFQEDFYTYSRIPLPLTFMRDDLLLNMANGQRNYFKLNAQNAQDNHDHYFHFTLHTQKQSPYIRTYKYVGHTLEFPTN
ncbi:DUF5960 family protein [Eremococcus coleocola]|uniref:Uncharacterized protein n=1 Tax=Eremococcus coleocola ACS-139-V-Col8 TaxID=908337 RepID=E4KPR8_9LACT|nr:DUF5960 family protein [Eremococcus coleocola]EFR31324.1 hypothetical protein HMPREF9257_1557 [Eremococcus coleocola ACS-139-V-Col8]